jgi:hypothetical protein
LSMTRAATSSSDILRYLVKSRLKTGNRVLKRLLADDEMNARFADNCLYSQLCCLGPETPGGRVVRFFCPNSRPYMGM